MLVKVEEQTEPKGVRVDSPHVIIAEEEGGGYKGMGVGEMYQAG